MLGLCEQVGGALPRRRTVRDHDDLARPGRQVDPTRLETSSFAAVTYAFPGPTILSTAGSSRCRTRAPRPPARRRPRRPRRSRAPARRRESRRPPAASRQRCAGHPRPARARRSSRVTTEADTPARHADPTESSGSQRRSDTIPERPRRVSRGRCASLNGARRRSSPQGLEHVGIDRAAATASRETRSVRTRAVERSVHSSRPRHRARARRRRSATATIASSRPALPSRHEPLDRKHEDRGRAGLLERGQQRPDVVRIDGGVHGDLALARRGGSRWARPCSAARPGSRAASSSGRSSSRSVGGARRRRRRASARAARRARALDAIAPRRRSARPATRAASRCSRRPLALAVEPVETRSTIASASPSRGAASTEPETGTSSTSMPRSSSRPGRHGIGGRDSQPVEVAQLGLRRISGRRPAACSARSRARRA